MARSLRARTSASAKHSAVLQDGEEHAERRLDSDGEAYTFDEFVEYYGGTAEWEAAATQWEEGGVDPASGQTFFVNKESGARTWTDPAQAPKKGTQAAAKGKGSQLRQSRVAAGAPSGAAAPSKPKRKSKPSGDGAKGAKGKKRKPAEESA